MIYLHKILPLVVSPLALILFLLVIGLYKKWRSATIFAIVLLYLISMPIFSKGLLRLVENNLVRLQPSDMQKVDAIVVLSGMLTWVPARSGLIQEWGDPDRFWGGVELMQADKAPLLMFTGGKLPWELGQGNEGEFLKKYAQLLNVPGNKIIVTADVQNTEQEADAVRHILKNQQNIILVTSAFHMTRAKSLFELKGFNVFAYPVDFRASEQSNTVMSFLPNAGGIGQTDVAVRELMGIGFYKLKAQISSLFPTDIIKR